MEIKVLGPGCSKCKVTYKQVVKAVSKLDRSDVRVIKIEDVKEIMNYNIMSSPALMIDEEIKVVGRVPSVKEIIELINTHSSKEEN
jgi:small redox-active disulfide protein 2